MQQRVASGGPSGLHLPVSTATFLLVGGIVGVAAEQYPHVVAPVSLGLATFLTLERLHRSIR